MVLSSSNRSLLLPDSPDRFSRTIVEIGMDSSSPPKSTRVPLSMKQLTRSSEFCFVCSTKEMFINFVSFQLKSIYYWRLFLGEPTRTPLAASEQRNLFCNVDSLRNSPQVDQNR